MFLKNYTSAVPVSQTISRIEQVLIRCRVTGITKEYSPDGEVIAFRFHFPVNDQREATVRLPADKRKAQEALWKDYAGDDLQGDGITFKWGCRKTKKRSDFADQAHRTAWAIVRDWVEVQMSMIQLNQAKPAEVFLPYIYDSQTKTTIFEKIEASRFAGLLPEASADHDAATEEERHPIRKALNEFERNLQ